VSIRSRPLFPRCLVGKIRCLSLRFQWRETVRVYFQNSPSRRSRASWGGRLLVGVVSWTFILLECPQQSGLGSKFYKNLPWSPPRLLNFIEKLLRHWRGGRCKHITHHYANVPLLSEILEWYAQIIEQWNQDSSPNFGEDLEQLHHWMLNWVLWHKAPDFNPSHTEKEMSPLAEETSKYLSIPNCI